MVEKACAQGISLPRSTPLGMCQTPASSPGATPLTSDTSLWGLTEVRGLPPTLTVLADCNSASRSPSASCRIVQFNTDLVFLMPC